MNPNNYKSFLKLKKYKFILIESCHAEVVTINLKSQNWLL